MTVYSPDFYDDISDGSLRSARLVLETLRSQSNFDSVFDYGCGPGAWLKAAQELGASKVNGIEGHWLREVKTFVEADLIEYADLEKTTPNTTGPFDLVVCMEVLEHMTEDAAIGAVSWMCMNGKQVLLSAAVPGQGGNNHINEQWQSYWIEQFASHGFYPSFKLRDLLWDTEDIEAWYRQNMILYSPSFSSTENQSLNNVVHPEIFGEVVGRLGKKQAKLDRRLHKRLLKYLNAKR